MMNGSYLHEDEENMLEKNRAFIDYLVRRGLLADETIVNADVQKRRKEMVKKAYHNTEMLLDNYRDMVWALETVPAQIASELDMPFATLDELMERIDLEMGMNNKRLESRLNSVTKSRLLIDRINEALSVIRMKPKVGEDLYRIIYKTFIDPSFCGCSLDIIYDLNLSRRKYYDLRREAIKLISWRLWSAPNRETEVWLDVLMMLEKERDNS